LDDCEKFQANLQSELVEHSSKLRELAAIAEDLFELCSSVHRSSDAQENAFKAISERLKHWRMDEKKETESTPDKGDLPLIEEWSKQGRPKPVGPLSDEDRKSRQNENIFIDR
jgi:septal ring factor EnvC (AmiA/AmiB activator)